MKQIFTLLIAILLVSCNEVEYQNDDKIQIVTTTTIVTDIVKNVGGEKVNVSSLMGPGIDPHLYKATEGDVAKLANAEIIIYSGLHLEGKLVDVFSKIERLGKHPVNLGEALSPNQLIESENFGGTYDPHVWFDVSLFIEQAKEVARVLQTYKPEEKEYFESNLRRYTAELEALQHELHELIAELPKDRRKLVTAHDAFGYFGKAFDFEVVGLQGLSTTTEAGVQDVKRVSDFIVEHKIKSIFIESSVPRRTIEALQQTVLAKGHQVEIGDVLYSDALGTEGTPEESYIGMFRHNVTTIVEGLK